MPRFIFFFLRLIYGTITLVIVFVCVFLIASPAPVLAADTILHNFAGGTSDGKIPQYGPLVQSGSVLYGVTSQGGSLNHGVIFSVNTDGTGFTILHNFAGGSSDGVGPIGNLILSGTTLYGTTEAGGTSNDGTVFSISTSGTGFTLIHSFTNAAGDGYFPEGGVILSGSTLYGMTLFGYTGFNGVIYSVGTDGTGFTMLHSFAGGVSDGKTPVGNLIISGSTLYGMTSAGGASSKGVVFSISTSGTGFTLLHSFAGGSGDGSSPNGDLLLSGSTLYGMANLGGASNLGTIFSITAGGASFAVLHSFLGGTADGSKPLGTPSFRVPRSMAWRMLVAPLTSAWYFP